MLKIAKCCAKTTTEESLENNIKTEIIRDLQHLLGYSKWENLTNVIVKAKMSCEVTNNEVFDHFPDIRKKVQLGSGSEREIDDIMLTRYACYLIAQNDDPRKDTITFAQNYFALQI